MCGGGGDDPKEQESKLALAQQAANALQRYGEVFVPLENMFISDTKAMFEDGASDQAMAAAQNQTSAIYEQGFNDMRGAQFQAGLDPMSGRAQGESNALVLPARMPRRQPSQTEEAVCCCCCPHQKNC